MRMKMESSMEVDNTTAEDVNAKTFTFSHPNVVSSGTTFSDHELAKEQDRSQYSIEENVYTFAAPTNVFNVDATQLYKAKTTTDAFKPSINMFAQALKNTAVYERLNKNARSQVIVGNVENSITCKCVPKELLSKAAAKEFFSRYGHISKISIRPKKQITTVYYASKEDANAAYHKIRESTESKLIVEWTKADSPARLVGKKRDEHKSDGRLLEPADDDVKAELEAMTGLEYSVRSLTKASDAGNELSGGVGTKKGRAQPASKGTSKSMYRAEKVSGKCADKHDSDSQIATPLHNASMEELQSVIRQVALTSEDRYKVLEARDRLMRLKRVKSHSLATAKATSGTCPDMCPEKERLMRESQRQVAPYEQLEGNEYKINHMTAVKQYSRSSADQEEPMSHELRPVGSLKMTMSYLLHEIANLCEVDGTNLGEWYHFLWDRTRGIRKDITQQELCCVDSVELVEQCARFHIVCSERLCAEEASVFDKKINSENLTKCLQSLKYMYHDLRVKGIVCPNEAEFRAYIVLLNLNNSNFMWDLQRLPLSVQTSPEVRFAIEVYNSIESNNYCKFFKLVRRTTYLNACILLRYFNQVRVNALSVMVKAYCRTTSTAYPLYELIDNLGFEDENEAIVFAEQLGLSVSSDGLHVMLDRRSFSLPETSIEQGRAHNLVESKRIGRNLCVGRCIAGGKMPERTYKNHRPHSSFDSRGYLLARSVNAEDQNGPVAFVGERDADMFDGTRDPAENAAENAAEDAAKDIAADHATRDATSSAKSYVKCHVETAKRSSSWIDVSAVPPGMQTSSNTRTSPADPFARRAARLSPVEVAKGEANRAGNSDCEPTASQLAQHDEKSANITSDGRVKPMNAKDPSLLPSATIPASTATMPNAKLARCFDSVDTAVRLDGTTATCGSRFGMVGNKSIFGGTVRGNLFAETTLSPSSMFAASPDNSNGRMEGMRASITRADENERAGGSAWSDVREVTSRTRSYDGSNEFQGAEGNGRSQGVDEGAVRAFNELQDEVVREACCAIVSEEADKLRVYDSLGRDIGDATLHRVVEEECASLLHEELIFYEKLRDMSARKRNRMMIKYLDVWRRQASKRRRQKEALSETPVWLQKQSADELANTLYRREQEEVIGSMYGSSGSRACPPRRTCRESRLAPIEIIIYAGVKENAKSLDVDGPTCMLFFKLVISWPSLENRPVLWKHKRSINEYLHYGLDPAVEPILKVYRPSPHEALHLSIRQTEGFVDAHQLVGMDALLFIAAASEGIQFVVKRLTKTVLSREKLMPVPLTFVALADDESDESDFESHRGTIVSNLESLLDAGYVSSYTIAYEKILTEKSALNLVQSAGLWLSVNKSPPVPLEMDYLRELYQACLADEFWHRVLGHSSYNRELALGLEQPDFIINLHNEAVLHFMDIMLDPESLLYTQFAPELKALLSHPGTTLPCGYMYFDDHWKSSEYRAKLEDALSGLILPRWSSLWPSADTQELRRNVIDYCRAALPNTSRDGVSRSIFGNLYLATGSLNLTSFANIILYIVKEKAKLLNEELKVVYNKNHVKHFRTFPWWLKSNAFAELAVRIRKSRSQENDHNGESVMKKRKFHRQDGAFDEYQPLVEFCNDTRARILDVYCSSEDLESRIKVQQLQDDLFEQKLMEALSYDNTTF